MGAEAVEHAKKQQQAQSEWRVLSTGVRAKIIPVGATLIDEVVARVQDPPVPVIFDEDKGQEIENPMDLAYQQALRDANRKRSVAALDAMIMFGLEIESLPEDNTWLLKLQFLAKRGVFDLTEYDLENEIDLKFLYKKYIATGTKDLIAIGKEAGLNQQDVEQAAATFPGK